MKFTLNLLPSKIDIQTFALARKISNDGIVYTAIIINKNLTSKTEIKS